MNSPSRRTFLAAVAASAVGSAGCLGDESRETDTTSTGTTPTAGPAGTPTATQTATSTSTDSTPTATDPPTDTPTETPPSESAALAWRRGFDAAVTADPVVGADRVFAGSESGTVRAFDDSGVVGWTFEASSPVQDLTLAEDVLLALTGTNELSSGHVLHGVDAASGEERWTFSPTSWWLEILGTADGTAYVATADDALSASGETLYALTLAAGDTEWSAEIGDPREAVVTDDALFVSATGRTYGFDRGDGRQRWAVETEDRYGTLAVVDGTVVQAVDAEESDRYSVLLGFDPDSGEERWRFDSWDVTSTVAADRDLFAGGARTAALDPSEGTVRWEDETPGFLTDASLTDGRLFAGGNTLTAYASEDGSEAWTFTPEPAQGGVSAAGVADGTLYLDAYHDADVRNQYKFAVDVEGGAGRWAFENGTELTDLVIGGGLALTGGEDGVLYALR
ncbi:outer membrane protein assembly factor BamB family protein [Halosimplex salinum]|uniref:outer membrane protein assembly factor BamB family protein n=1 Tax=Halosimplex salinum TaxID=1710538 RepID=UPI000F4A4B8A|nr:PQQ-binding-like beta-propeller repeat protein [Halosimplex salinum]